VVPIDAINSAVCYSRFLTVVYASPQRLRRGLSGTGYDLTH
jgi:hypothetical protein